MTSPPEPPLAPSGPPRGLNFSRRTEAQPLPPSPPRACRTTRSTKLVIPWFPPLGCALRQPLVCCGRRGGHPEKKTAGAQRRSPLRPRRRSVGSGVGQDDVHDPAAAPVAELHRSGLEREQGVVPAAAHVATRVEVGAPLADEDLAGLHGLAAKALDTEPLRVGVAPVLGGAGALLRCHGGGPFVCRSWMPRCR